MVYIFLGQGFEEIEAITPGDILRRGGVPVSFTAVGGEKLVTGGHGISVMADTLAGEISPVSGDTLVIPGGAGGVESIKSDGRTMKMLALGAENGAEFAAICAGPSVLALLGLLDGKTITCYPGCESLMGKAVCQSDKAVVTDGTLVTARAPGAAIAFGLALLAHIKGPAASEKVKTELVY